MPTTPTQWQQGSPVPFVEQPSSPIVLGGSVPAMVGDTGSGGSAGLVPAPPAGSAAAGKFLKADGTFAVPPGTANIAAVTNEWLDSIVTGVPHASQPNFTNLAGSATVAQLPTAIPNANLANPALTITAGVGLSTGGAVSLGGSVTVNAGSNENLSFNATPTFSTLTAASTITLAGNITSFTLGAGIDGQRKVLTFIQGSGAYTVAPPASVHGFFTVGATNGGYNTQAFTYLGVPEIWVAEGTGVINQ
jgi:hypothetical protein